MTAYNCPTELKLLPCFNTTYNSHKTKYQMVCAIFYCSTSKKAYRGNFSARFFSFYLINHAYKYGPNHLKIHSTGEFYDFVGIQVCKDMSLKQKLTKSYAPISYIWPVDNCAFSFEKMQFPKIPKCL